MPCISFRERMSGSYWLLESPTEERALALSFEAHADDVADFLRTRTWALAGTIEAEGLARRREIEGSIRYALITERRVPYRFAFRGDDGRRYDLVGQKEWIGLAPMSSMTLLPATLVNDAGQEVARATLRFDLVADFGDWVKSFRLRV